MVLYIRRKSIRRDIVKEDGKPYIFVKDFGEIDDAEKLANKFEKKYGKGNVAIVIVSHPFGYEYYVVALSDEAWRKYYDELTLKKYGHKKVGRKSKKRR